MIWQVFRGAFEAYRFTGMPEDREKCVVRLTELTQGWPQHTKRISVAAVQVILEYGGLIMMEHLEEVLAQGRKPKDTCCAMPLEADPCNSRVCRQLALAAKERDGGLSRHEIGRLTISGRRRRRNHRAWMIS